MIRQPILLSDVVVQARVVDGNVLVFVWFSVEASTVVREHRYADVASGALRNDYHGPHLVDDIWGVEQRTHGTVIYNFMLAAVLLKMKSQKNRTRQEVLKVVPFKLLTPGHSNSTIQVC